MVCNNQEGDFECVDIDECTDKVDECGDGYRQGVQTANLLNFENTQASSNRNQNITDFVFVILRCLHPSYRCQNILGGYVCLDVDECVNGNSKCADGFTCVNTEGSFDCVDFDECEFEPYKCQEGFQFRWLKIKEIFTTFPISITIFSNHPK